MSTTRTPVIPITMELIKKIVLYQRLNAKKSTVLDNNNVKMEIPARTTPQRNKITPRRTITFTRQSRRTYLSYTAKT